jgi:hypothetical protein
MATIILVDRIGEKSRIERLARELNGTIIQMSASYWPRQIAEELHRVFGFEHELIGMPYNQMDDYLKTALSRVPLEDFIYLQDQA